MTTQLVQKAFQAASPYANYSLKNVKYFSGSKKVPHIETHAFTINGNTNAIYQKRQLRDNHTFESFQNNGESLKVIKNRFGEIISHKANFKIPLDDIQRVYINACEAMRVRLNSLYHVPEHMLSSKNI